MAIPATPPTTPPTTAFLVSGVSPGPAVGVDSGGVESGTLAPPPPAPPTQMVVTTSALVVVRVDEPLEIEVKVVDDKRMEVDDVLVEFEKIPEVVVLL